MLKFDPEHVAKFPLLDVIANLAKDNAIDTRYNVDHAHCEFFVNGDLHVCSLFKDNDFRYKFINKAYISMPNDKSVVIDFMNETFTTGNGHAVDYNFRVDHSFLNLTLKKLLS